ncbi:PREDICTED: regulator of hypoxia-inducible factor 1-like [Papilio polytes]|uniref:regulator of hypoxia-inducible factor 1-like n=1 Tax=Papilio polytes TaxID=76194 RepID=UPI0006760EE0|nr:PREDICTED: regulator of hypoxia-inducible factor 1-like [Papilio polytes]
MSPFTGILWCVLIVTVAAIKDDNEVDRFPRLFHLDNYERCLSKKNGLYCLGTFQLSSDGPNSLYDSLKTLKYCRTNKQAKTLEDVELPHIIVALVVGVLLVLNVVENSILSIWSVKENWRRLICTYDDSDPIRAALHPIQGTRVLLLLLVIIAHAIETTYKLHLANPIFLETAQRNPMSIFLKNGTSSVQAFIVISNFLFAYMLLGYSQKKKVSLSMLPMCILYRIVRISPVYLLTIGFMSSWWRLAGDGPMWSDLVISESEICRQKFWMHAFYVHNLVHPEKWCMLQSWFLAVDMQLYVIACFLTLLLVNNRRRALYVIGWLFVASCVLNSGLAYIYEWKSLMYLLSPENLRNTFEGVTSFWYFYISPWGSLPACLLGLFVAHLQFYAKEQGFQITNTKWIVHLYHIAVPLCVAWVFTGHIMSTWTTRLSMATYIGIERPMFSAICALLLYGSIDNLDNCFRRWMAWRGWQVPARLSLCVLVIHRVINTQLVAVRTAAVTTSVVAITIEVIITTFATYLLAIPMMLLVEMPIQRTFVAYISRGKQLE